MSAPPSAPSQVNPIGIAEAAGSFYFLNGGMLPVEPMVAGAVGGAAGYYLDSKLPPMKVKLFSVLPSSPGCALVTATVVLTAGARYVVQNYGVNNLGRLYLALAAFGAYDFINNMGQNVMKIGSMIIQPSA